MSEIPHTEDTLDPQDWEELRKIGHKMVDDVVDYLQAIRERPVWKAMPDQAKAEFKHPVPKNPEDIQQIYNDFLTYILPYNKGNVHPRFWAWVQGTGTPLAVFADMLASAMNANVTIGEQSAMYVDKQVVNWCIEMMQFPPTASGMLVSGASMANLTALLVARNASLPNIRESGMAQAGCLPLMYCSVEAHSCIGKAAEVIGVGQSGLRKIPVDDQYMIQIETLRTQIQKDIADGFMPIAIIGNAGTVNTGAIDDLNALLRVAKEFGLWLHVDGAFGALAGLTPQYSQLRHAISQADSVAFDLHKWMYMPYEVGCVLIRDKDLHRQAFANAPTYLIQHSRGLAAGMDSLNNYGIELSRGFKALKVWMSLREHGIDKIAGQIQKNIEQANYLASYVGTDPSLQLMAPVSLNIVCFRYIVPEFSGTQLDWLNREIVMRLQEEGIASPSYAILEDAYCIRVAITNHRSKTQDFDMLTKEVLRLGALLQNDVPNSFLD